MKRIVKYFLLLTLVCSSAYAQQPRILAMSVASTTPAADTTEYGIPIIDSTTMFTAMMTVILDNTDSIYQLHVKLGNTLHGSQFLSTSFNYGVSGTFGSTTYSQTGNTIQLGLGAHAGMISCFAEVQIEKTDHTYEDAVLFSIN